MIFLLIFSVLLLINGRTSFVANGTPTYTPTPNTTNKPWNGGQTTYNPRIWSTTNHNSSGWATTTYAPWNVTNTTESPSTMKCPDGFTVLNGKKCVKLFQTPMTYFDALNFCTSNTTNGSLVSIQNAIDNRALVSLASSLGHSLPAWIGLNCSITGNPSSCEWIDGSGTAGTYNNFASGNPFVDVGPSVYMLTTGGSAGKWVSGDEYSLSIGFFCEVPPKNTAACQNPFNGYCYNIHLTPQVDSVTSRTTCISECSDVISIHSQAENDHILSIFSQFPSNEYMENYLRIGGFTDGFGKYWLDGSTWNYDNFGYFNSQLGACMTMAVRDDIVPRGSWMSNNCAVQTGFICKRAQNSTC
ncbi:unnamed protein product [Caenorhabditis brenneri]